MKIAAHGCPVCGFPEFVALEEGGGPTDNICPSCGSHSGYTYQDEVSEEHLESVRRDWLYKESGRWWSRRLPVPSGWSAQSQMRLAGIAIPKP